MPGEFVFDPSRFVRVFAESGAGDFSPVAERVRHRRGRVVYTLALRVAWAGLSPWSVIWNVRGTTRIRIGWPQRQHSTGRLAGWRDDDVQHQLRAFEQDLAAMVGEAVVATAPKAAWQQVAEHQVAEQQLTDPRRIGLIGSVHRGSLVSRETASDGRTNRVRETRVDQAAA